MKHPNEVQLALFAGGDLGYWDRWRVRRHVSRCSTCESEVQSSRTASEQVRELTAELPKDINWQGLAEEMTGNIRVGLAAGEAIAGFNRPAATGNAGRVGWNAATVVACATAVFVAAFWINVPQPQKDNLLSNLKRIRTDRIGTLMQGRNAAQEDVVLEASSFGIEVKENGRTMSMTHPNSPGVTVLVNMKGSAGVRYVDADTGQVTTNKVYYAEQ